MTTSRFLVALATLGLAGAVFAQTAPTTPAPGAGPADGQRPMMGGRHHFGGHGMRQMDTDGDGQISKAELQAAHERRMAEFDRADANKDGKLSREEMRAFRCEQRGKRGPGGPGGPAAPGAAPQRGSGTVAPNA